MPEKMSDAQTDEALAELDGWTRVEGRDAIFRSYKFASFNEAFA